MSQNFTLELDEFDSFHGKSPCRFLSNPPSFQHELTFSTKKYIKIEVFDQKNIFVEKLVIYLLNLIKAVKRNLRIRINH